MKKYLLLTFVFTLFLASPAKAYDTYIAHPGIAGLTVDTYNQAIDKNKITDKEKEWIKKGSIQEDTPTRWVNHFFDPIRGYGLKSIELSSPIWSEDSFSQANFSLGDKSWKRAIDDYNKGNKELAFKELGHIIHLLEDLSVPAHTRDDIHVSPGDSYENYVKDNWNNISSSLKGKIKYIESKTLTDSFIDMAIFTNTRFLSDDTIVNSNYEYPKIDKNSSGYVDYLNKDGERHKLVYLYKETFSDYIDVFFKKEKYKLNNTVLSDYAQTLIPQAVGRGAGVIELFFKEAERLKNEDLKLSKKRITLLGMLDTVKGFFIQNFENDILPYYKAHTAVAKKENKIKISASGQIYQIPKISISDERKTQIKKIISDTFINTQILLKKQKPTKKELPNTQLVLPPNTITVKDSTEKQTNEKQTNEKNNKKIVKTKKPENTTTTIPQVVLPPNTVVVGKPIAFVHTPTSITQTPQSNSGSSNNQINTTPTQTNATTPTTTPTSTPDTAPPTIPTITSVDQSTINLSNIHITLNSTDETSSSVFYDLSYSLAPYDASTTVWTSIATSTTSTEFDFTGNRGQSYIFKSRSKDESNNYSEWSNPTNATYIDWNKQIVINEIAWAGTTVGLTGDEWIELYNNTNEEINFASSTWQIVIDNGTSTTTIDLNNTILPNSYYLLERTDDTTLNDFTADQIYTGALKNTGARIIIKKDGQIVDEVNASNGWFAGSNSPETVYFPSMQRKNTLLSGSQSDNWKSAGGFTLYNNKLISIYGSPKQSNDSSIYLVGNQLESVRTLSPDNNPYILSEYTVPNSKKLVIEAGVVFKGFFKPAKLSIYGELEAIGTQENNIVFTSGRDNTFSTEKLNVIFGSWSNTTTPESKDWAGLRVFNNGTANLDYVNIKYAGYESCLPPFCGTKVSRGLWSEDSEVNINNSNIASNGEISIYLKNTTSTIQNTSFNNGNQAIYSESSRINLNTISFENYTNTNGPTYFRKNWPTLSNLTFVSTTFDGIYGVSNTISEEVNITKDLNYILSGTTVSASGTLNIGAGSNIYLPHYGSMTINGTLNTLGTNSEPITFLPYTSGTSWGNITFNNSTSTIQHTVFKHGGSLTITFPNQDGTLVLNNSNITIDNSRLEDNTQSTSSILSKDSNITIKDSFIGHNTTTTLKGISYSGGTLSANNITMKNLAYGFYGTGSPAPEHTITNTPTENYLSVVVPIYP